MNTKTLGPGKIDFTGFKSVLLHTMWASLFAILLALLDTLSHHNWGDLQPFAIPVFTFVIALVKKTAETYSVTQTDNTVQVTDDTGPVSPSE